MTRKSFASIELKIHSNVNREKFDLSISYDKSTYDKEIILDIFNSFKQLNEYSNDGTGEWNWLQKKKQNNFIKSLSDFNIDKITYFLTNMFKTEATYGLLSPSFSDFIKDPELFKSNILCNIDACFEFTDIQNLEQLKTQHGNPYGLRIKSGIVLPDSPRHYYFGYNISRLLREKISNPIIVEIGGGYGGLCLQNWRQFNGNCTLVNIDLFPTLITSAYYLKKNKIPINLVTVKNPIIKKGFVNLIAANNSNIFIKNIKKCDLIFNSRSLCEMDKETVSNYFNFINSSEVKYFYHENSNFLLFPNSKRHIEIMGDDFPINSKKFKLLTKYITPFTGGDGRYREYIYERR